MDLSGVGAPAPAPLTSPTDAAACRAAAARLEQHLRQAHQPEHAGLAGNAPARTTPHSCVLVRPGCAADARRPAQVAALRALAAALDEFGMTLAGLQLRERALRERATAAAGASPPTAAPASSQNGSPCEPDEPANPQSHRLRSEAGRAHSLLRRQLADIAHALRP